MPTSQTFLDGLKKRLVLLDDVRFKPMMGEYLMHYRGKYVATVCDERLHVKPVECVKEMLDGMPMEIPYAGAKPCYRVTKLDDAEFLLELFDKLYENLPAPKKKK